MDTFAQINSNGEEVFITDVILLNTLEDINLTITYFIKNSYASPYKKFNPNELKELNLPIVIYLWNDKVYTMTTQVSKEYLNIKLNELKLPIRDIREFLNRDNLNKLLLD